MDDDLVGVSTDPLPNVRTRCTSKCLTHLLIKSKAKVVPFFSLLFTFLLSLKLNSAQT